MRKIAVLILAAAGVSLAGAASAADLGAAPIYRKAPPVINYMWQGAYVGLYAGGATGAGDMETTNPVTGAGAPVLPTNAAVANYNYGSSFVGGYTSGYNWQVSPNWVIGYESETGYMSIKGSSAFGASATGQNTIATTSINGLYSAWTARLGYAWDRSLIYAKGGLTLVQIETGVANSVAGQHLFTTDRKFEIGYAVGGGWEYALDPKWSVKAEYLYLGFSGDFKTTGNFNSGAPQNFSTTSLAGIHTGKVGVNYKFDALGYFLGAVR